MHRVIKGVGKRLEPADIFVLFDPVGTGIDAQDVVSVEIRSTAGKSPVVNCNDHSSMLPMIPLA